MDAQEVAPTDRSPGTRLALEKALIDAADSLLAFSGQAAAFLAVPGSAPIRCVVAGDLASIRALVAKGDTR